MDEKKNNFLQLFNEKKYSLIVSIIENKIPLRKKTSRLLNLSGVCRILSRKSSDSIKPAINDFREACLKENDENKLIEPLRNLVNSYAIFFDEEHTKNEKFLTRNFFDEIYKLKEQYKNLFEKDLELMKNMLKISKRSLSIKNHILNLKKLSNLSTDPDLVASYNFYNNYLYDWSQADYLENSKKINKKLTSYPKEKLSVLIKKRKKKINLAFISSDLKSKHSITYFLKSLLIHYDKNLFNIYIYHNHNMVNDSIAKEFENFVSKSVYIFNLKDIEVINTVRRDEIDIIVDLNGFSSDHRIVLFKNRLAPIQISWCGYTNTTGLTEMDYLIVDNNLVNYGEENLYSEKLIYLQNIWNCHCGYEFERSKNELPFKKNKFITFGSFNNFNKLSDEVIEAWSLILKSVKNSRLLLKTSIISCYDIYLEKFDKYGVLNSIKFLNRDKKFDDHLYKYREIDISLDTFPWNGVTTSFESVWMNVPVITMDGYNFSSRCGASINKNLNLLELIGINKNDYVNKAVSLAKNTNKLIQIRDNLFDNALSSPLFDTKKFSDQFFSSLKKLYNN
tara:strand:+ start:2036 stop:3724 length:1689 start_codon:yes stop_codon:yes gene_type:complete